MGVVNHEDNERGWDGLYLESLMNDHFPAYVGGPRFVNPIFYSLVNDVLSVCIGGASIMREALASVSFLKNGNKLKSLPGDLFSQLVKLQWP